MDNADGKVVIQVDAETKQFDLKMKKLEHSAEKTAKQIEKSETLIDYRKMNADQEEEKLKALEEEQQEVDELIERYNELNRKEKELREQGKNLTIEDGIELASLAQRGLIDEAGELEQKIEKQRKKVDEVYYALDKESEKLDELKFKQNLLNDQIAMETQKRQIAEQKALLKEQQEEIKKIKQLEEEAAEAREKHTTSIKKSIDNIGSGIRKVTKKVVRWGLAVFGVRSAYLAIRQAMSVLSQYDEKLKADLDYIKFALAMALKPIVEWIVELAYKLLGLLNGIMQTFFGINLFANASTKAFKNANKEAKKLKKTIAGFDEMNVLNSNNDSGAIPTQDLSKLKEIPEWMKFIGQIKEWISEILPIITIIFAILFKIKKLGLYIAIYGIWKTFKEIKQWLKEPTFNNFLGVLQGIATTVSGIAILFGAWPVAIGAALALIVVTIIKNWDTIKETIINGVIWLGDWLEQYFGLIGELIGNSIEGAVNFIISTFDGLIQPIKRIYDGIIRITQGDFVGGISDIFGGLIDALTWPFRTLANFISHLWDNYIKRPIETIVNKIKKALGFQVDMEFRYSAGGGGYSSAGGGGGSLGGRAKGGIFYPSKLPKLAVGGIINRPGPGVAYNGAYIGERGAEAVVPLTDSQQMELLGATIGRYININLTNITELDGRTIARKVDKINQNNNFVLNR